MKRIINNSYKETNLRANSSTPDNYRNHGAKRIVNSINYKNNNYRDNKCNNYNFNRINNNYNINNYLTNESLNQDIRKQKTIIDNMLNGLKKEIHEMSKSIEKTDSELHRYIDSNSYENNLNLKINF